MQAEEGSVGHGRTVLGEFTLCYQSQNELGLGPMQECQGYREIWYWWQQVPT